MSDLKDDNYWKNNLTSEQYFITRKGGTERPFSGKFNDHKEHGTYVCICCSAELFDSNAKFESFSGWPSFFRPIRENVLSKHNDFSHNMNRTEIKCKNCDSHLGHVFNDGPIETGMRYCVNSISLNFKKYKDKS